MLRSLLSSVIVTAVIGAVAISAMPSAEALVTPSITTLSPKPIGANGTLTVSGTGCPTSSPVSLYLWNTSGGAHFNVDNATTAAVDGTFSTTYPLAGQFDPGSGIGVRASCSTTFDSVNGSDAYADQSYVQVTLTDPVVRINAPRRATYGTATRIEVDTSNGGGALAVTVGGHSLNELLSTSTWTRHYFDVPVRLWPGSYTINATFDSAVAGAPTVHTSAPFTVLRRAPRLALQLSAPTVRKGSTVAARVTLSSTGIAPRTGKVVLKRNGRIVATGQLRSADNGVRIFAVWFRAIGSYHLTAVYLGSSTLNPATSPTRTLTVHG